MASVENESSTLSIIENFMKDSTYREIIESSANFNTRLRIERKNRLPFLDPQTGVAQTHSNLFLSSRQRMPGTQHGQVYTYPSKPWRKKRRQYATSLAPFCKDTEADNAAANGNGESGASASIENVVATSTDDGKESSGSKEDKVPDAWYYDELEMQDMDGFDEPEPDSDDDYEDSYAKKKRKPRVAPAKPTKGGSLSDSPARKALGSKPSISGRGGRRNKGVVYVPEYPVDHEKPYYCDLCGARYKTRPGLTYHYTHSHKDKTSVAGSAISSPGGGVASTPPSITLDGDSSSDVPSLPSPIPSTSSGGTSGETKGAPSSTSSGGGGWNSKFQEAAFTSSTSTGTTSSESSKKNTRSQPASSNQDSDQPSTSKKEKEKEKEIEKPDRNNTGENYKKTVDKDGKAKPSPYCDFCLGTESSNKKSGGPEEMVSCSDCGRSGHPSCLQFTANMIISVKKYRWQCIECKCCTMCGKSDNDDQLLFCDDCDRGYHMYCLSPALTEPPDGSWSCKLCMKEFHK